MPTIVRSFDWPDRVVVGTVGRPGQRAFYLQARAGAEVVSVALEKMQSALLAEKIDELLDALMAEPGNPFSVPATVPEELSDDEPLDQPVEPEFRVGRMGLGWDPSTRQLVIEAYPLEELDEDDEDEDSEPEEVLLLRIPVGTARAFAKRTLEFVAAGRPPCPRCGGPVDPEGHLCPLPDDLEPDDLEPDDL